MEGWTQEKTAKDLAISPPAVRKAIKIATAIEEYPELASESSGQAILQEYQEKTKPHVAFNSGESEWYTPSEYIESARKVMGSINCDPASSDSANKIVKALQYFTKKDDGRTKEWTGNIFLNPPYSQPLITEFTNLLVDKYISGEIKQACVLVNNATDTGFYQSMLTHCKAVCFIKGRVKFINEDGKASGAPLQGQTILYFGNRVSEFTDNFSQYGVILYACM